MLLSCFASKGWEKGSIESHSPDPSPHSLDQVDEMLCDKFLNVVIVAVIHAVGMSPSLLFLRAHLRKPIRPSG